MNAPELFVETHDRRTAFAPGEILEVNALWALPAAPTAMEVRLCWFTRGKGTVDVGIVSTRSISPLTPAGEQAIRFTLPDGPYSFSGKLISLLWAVELVAQPGARSARSEFTLAPGGKEVVLTPLPNASRKR